MILRTDETSDKLKPRENIRAAGDIEERKPYSGNVSFTLTRFFKCVKRTIGLLKNNNNTEWNTRIKEAKEEEATELVDISDIGRKFVGLRNLFDPAREIQERRKTRRRSSSRRKILNGTLIRARYATKRRDACSSSIVGKRDTRVTRTLVRYTNNSCTSGRAWLHGGE